jgi:nitrous oxide reductase accessory protein NosL
MMSARVAARASAMFVALAMISCGSPDDAQLEQSHEAAAIHDQEDAVCGMLVRAQSAPRGQVVHRDGSRFFFCSLGDLLVHLAAPSPHGRAEATFVEVMELGEDPAESHTGAHRWVSAEAAIYVIGIDRPGIMGEPVLAYATPSEAESAMLTYGGMQSLDLTGLIYWWQDQQSAR